MTFKYAGTVSHGTLNGLDLIPAFMAVLKELSPEQYTTFSERERIALNALNGEYDNHPDYTPEQVAAELEDATELVNDLCDTLDSLAPDGYTFGNVEGDASDYGFWQSDDEEGDEIA